MAKVRLSRSFDVQWNRAGTKLLLRFRTERWKEATNGRIYDREQMESRVVLTLSTREAVEIITHLAQALEYMTTEEFRQESRPDAGEG